MFPYNKITLLISASLVSAAYPAFAQPTDPETTELSTVVVTEQADTTVTEGSKAYTTPATDSATKFKLSPKQTPQTVSTITHAQMEDYAMSDIQHVMASTPGVNVEQVETNRTYYTSRGFDITNFQTDGSGMPLTFGNQQGDIDTIIYDHIDITKGANALLNGTGDPSATVNMVRKRPTEETQISLNGAAGSWDQRRVEGDVSGKISENGKLRGRVVTALQDKDSYLDRYSANRNVFYGIAEADLTDNTMLTVGMQYQENKTDSPLWGALPLVYRDGSPTNYDVSTSTATDWSYWNTKEKRGFIELSHALANDWKLKSSFTHIDFSQDSELFYVYGAPDKNTGLGLYAYPSAYTGANQQNIADINLSGPFQLFGREHQLATGASISHSNVRQWSGYGQGIGTSIGDFSAWNGQYAKPSFDASTNDGRHKHDQRTGYLASRFSVTDDLSLITGARWTNFTTEGVSYGVSQDSKGNSDVTPYVGVVYDLTANYALYASYSDIFTPQSNVDINDNVLAPVTGKAYETGVKGEFMDKRLNTTLALFKTKQSNVAESAGSSGGKTYYKGLDLQSEGYEFDIAGRVYDDLEVSGGFTHVNIENADGSEAKTYTPRNQIKTMATYRVQKWKMGAGVNWQSDIYTTVNSYKVTQDSYALLNLMAGYQFTPSLSATLNVYNVTNEKYYNSFYWTQAYYGAPRNAMLNVSWKY